jgi:hypothetical protein
MIYIILAIIASMALNAPLGMAIGFVLALTVALAQSHGTMRQRIRHVLGMGYVRAITLFAIACLVIDELDDWKVAAIVWLIAAFATGAWRTHGRLAAKDRWALLSRFAAAVAGLAMAWLNMNWVTTPMPVWFLLVALVSASSVKAALRWPNLPWSEHVSATHRRPAGALASLLMCAAIVGVSVA